MGHVIKAFPGEDKAVIFINNLGKEIMSIKTGIINFKSNVASVNFVTQAESDSVLVFEATPSSEGKVCFLKGGETYPALTPWIIRLLMGGDNQKNTGTLYFLDSYSAQADIYISSDKFNSLLVAISSGNLPDSLSLSVGGVSYSNSGLIWDVEVDQLQVHDVTIRIKIFSKMKQA